MTGKTRIREALAAPSAGGLYVVKGWVRTVRAGKEVAFIALNDGSCLANLQVVVDQGAANHAEVCRLGTGAALAYIMAIATFTLAFFIIRSTSRKL